MRAARCASASPSARHYPADADRVNERGKYPHGRASPAQRRRIGILNHLFFWPEQYRRTGEMSIVFLFDENPNVASAGSGGAAVGGARSVPDHAARSNSERAAPSACVGNRFSAPQIVWNRSNRRAGERGGARVGRPRWLRILMITGGSSMAALRRGSGQAMIFKAPPQFGQCSMYVEDPFEQPGPAHARRLSLAGA